MTPSELSKLTPEQKRVKIAEACGWLKCYPGTWPQHWMKPEHAFGTREHHLPDYLNDLNAALTLCDLLAEKGWWCELNNGHDKTWECEFSRRATAQTKPENLDGEGREVRYAPADTLAQAIVDTFLLTI